MLETVGPSTHLRHYSLHTLKLEAAGISKEKLTIAGAFAVLFSVIPPILVKSVVLKDSLKFSLKLLYYKQVVIVIVVVLTYWTPTFWGEGGWVQGFWYFLVILTGMVGAGIASLYNVAQQGFLCRVAHGSSTIYGGTWLTIFVSFQNFAWTLSEYIGAKGSDFFSLKEGDSVVFDGYYVVVILCLIFMVAVTRPLHESCSLLESKPMEAWVSTDEGKPIGQPEEVELEASWQCQHTYA